MTSQQANMPACPAPKAEVLLEGNLKALTVRDDAVYFVNKDEGPVGRYGATIIPAGVIQRLDLASGAVSTLYTPLQDEHIVDFALWGDAFAILLEGPVDLSFNVYLVPVAGGESQKIGPQRDFDFFALGCGLVGTLGDEVYLHNPNDATLTAFSRTGVPPRTVMADTGDPRTSFQLVGQRLWYSLDEGTTSEGMQTSLYSRDLASGSVPTEVYPDGCFGFGSRAARFQVTEDGIVCGAAPQITLLALDGSGSEKVADIPRLNDLRPNDALPSHTDGHHVYFAGSLSGLQVDLQSKQAGWFTCDPVAVDTIGTNAGSLIWGRTKNNGLLGDTLSNRTAFDAILRLPK
jgi:hypothetical protein